MVYNYYCRKQKMCLEAFFNYVDIVISNIRVFWYYGIVGDNNNGTTFVLNQDRSVCLISEGSVVRAVSAKPESKAVSDIQISFYLQYIELVVH